MDLTTQDVICYLPLNETDYLVHKKGDFQSLALFLLLVAGFFSYKESVRSALVSGLNLLVCITVSTIVLPIAFAAILIFATYRQLIITIQKVNLGNKYGGILLGPDAIWAIEDSYSKSIINVLMVVKSNESGHEFYKRTEQQTREIFFETSHQSSKVLATYKSCFGYFVLKKNTVRPGDCIKPLNVVGTKDELEKDDLMVLLSKISNMPLPKDHAAFWEIYIGTQSVRWNTPNQNCFPIVFRVHHALGDGISLLKVLTDTLVKRKPVTSAKVTVRKSWVCTLFMYVTNVCVLFQAPLAVLKQSYLRKKDSTSLHGPLLSGNKILVLATEKQESCIGIIKQIKQKIPGVKFSDVLLSAVSGSFQKYFIKNSEAIPDTITIAIPALLKYSQESQISSEGLTDVFQNSFSVALLDMPLTKENGTLHYVRTLKKIHKETNALNCSIDYQVNYWLLSIVSKYFPEQVLRPLIKSTEATLVISNLPGPSYLSIFEEYPLEDILFWIPHRGTTGVGLSILSYDGRLQIGLNVDKALISKKEDAQSIVDGILDEIVSMGDVINHSI